MLRQEIQGLRAVAVLLVVLFHLWPNRLPGGYVGVDVFFVISGFLITSHLVRELDRTGRVDLAGFWARRIRRLLPASYLVLAVSAVGVLVWVPRLVWQQFFDEILAAALYYENWALALDSVDYLAAENTPSPAQHYWTLSAEEQFYLVWPLLVLVGLWLGRRLTRGRGHHRPVFVVLAVTTGLSLAYSLWITATDPAWAYFVTPARAWEFGAGALLAFAPAAATRIGQTARALLGWAALLVLLSSAVVLDESTPMPGTAAIWVVVATALLIWVEAPERSWASSRPLSTAPARYVGDISYSVYLWHWPLVILLPHATGHELSTTDKLGILLATIALAGLTKRWVEDPVRRSRRLGLARPRITFAWAVVGAVVLTAVCVVPRTQVARDVERTEAVARKLAADAPRCFGAAARDPEANGCPNPELEDVLVPTPAAANRDFPYDPRCDARLHREPLVPCRFGNPSDDVPHLAVIGDSHARRLMSAVRELVDRGRVTADLLAVDGCPWSTTPSARKRAVDRFCGTFRTRLTPLLERTAKDYDFVVTTAKITTLSGTRSEQVDGFAEAWSRVTGLGVPVVVVRDNPQGAGPEDNPNTCLAEVSVREANERCALDREEVLDGWFDPLAAAARRTPGARFVDLSRFFCDATTCPVVVGGVGVYSDHNHVSMTYHKTLAPYLWSAFVRAGVAER